MDDHPHIITHFIHTIPSGRTGLLTLVRGGDPNVTSEFDAHSLAIIKHSYQNFCRCIEIYFGKHSVVWYKLPSNLQILLLKNDEDVLWSMVAAHLAWSHGLISNAAPILHQHGGCFSRQCSFMLGLLQEDTSHTSGKWKFWCFLM